MSIESGADLIIALLYSPGKSEKSGEGVRGITRLEKLLFLLMKEGGFEDKTGGELSYEPYDYGPYSGEAIDILDALKGAGLVQTTSEVLQSFKEVVDGLIAFGSSEAPIGEKPRTVEVYGLTERGMRIGKALFDGLSNEQRQSLKDLKSRFNMIDLNELLRYVYKRYPRMVQKSKILDQVLGFGSRPGLPAFKHSE